MVYGDCYFAERQVYESLINITAPIKVTKLNKFSKCYINLPKEVFNYCYDFNENHNFNLHCIMRTEKYYSFPVSDREGLETLNSLANFEIADVEIKSPNNPCNFMLAKVINFRA